LQANGSSYPTASSFAYKLSLDQPATVYNLSLCPSQVRQGEWVLAMYNPMPTTALAYNLTVHRIGRCLHNCSDNGRWVAQYGARRGNSARSTLLQLVVS
jgi:hypothetical protein